MREYIIEGWLYDTDSGQYLIKQEVKFNNLSDKERVMRKMLKQIKRRLRLCNTKPTVFRHEWNTYLDDNICLSDKRYKALVYEKRA